MRFTEEHQQLRRTVRDFVEKEINPHVDEWERRARSPRTRCSRRPGRLGLLGVNKPEAYGGMGLDYCYQMVVDRGARHVPLRRDPDGARRADRHGHARARALGHRRAEQEFLAPAIAGEVGRVDRGQRGVAAARDVAAIKTTARKDGSDYVINGSKMWITNAAQADWLCLLVNTGEGPVHANKTLVIVPTKTQGRRRSARRSTSSACAPATPARSSSRTCACRSATASARRAWAS